MQDMLNSRKRGDVAFRDKDFKTAIDCYTQVIASSEMAVKISVSICESHGCVYDSRLVEVGVILGDCDVSALISLAWLVFQFVDVGTMTSPTVFARRSLAYLLSEQAEAALRDAMQAQYVHPEWPTAFYMQAAALSRLGMDSDSMDMLKEGAALDLKKQSNTSGRLSNA